MRICQVTPGLLPIPPNGWGAVEKIIWEYHNNTNALGHQSEIKYLNDVDPTVDIIHTHVANLSIEAKNRGLDYIFTCHDHHVYVYGKDSDCYKQNLEAIDKSVLSIVPAKFLIPYFNYHPKLIYLEHGVNLDFFKPGKTPTEHRLLCVANNGFANDQGFDRKGFSYAVNAAKVLNLPITIVGPENNRNFFNSFRQDYKNLNIIYNADEQQLLNIYQEHTIFLHPSILEAGHPNLTLLEAMACGLPVVGTYETEGKLPGLFRVERDIDQIVTKLKYVIANYDQCRTLALDTAEKHSYKNITNKLIDIYGKTIEKQKSMKDQLVKIYEETPIMVKPQIEKQNRFNYTFIQGAKLEITGDKNTKYKVQFINRDTDKIEYTTEITNNCWCKPSKEYLVNWHIKVFENDILVSEHIFDLNNKNVYIAMDSGAIGDTIAWFPIFDEFRKKYNLNLTVSTFHNDWFEGQYPEIKFVTPGDTVYNLYAMYTVGWYYNEDGSINYNRVPTNFRTQPMIDTATSILGLPHMEIKPKLNIKKPDTDIQGKYVVIAPHASAHAKYWMFPGGWQRIIDHLNSIGYKVVMITKEPLGDAWHDSKLGGTLTGVINKTGDLPIEDRIADIKNADMFIGVGSGLSWISWALGTKTMMISGFSYPYTEFEDCIRIYNDYKNLCTGCFNRHRLDPGDWEWCPDFKNTPRMFECTKSISPEQIINEINKVLL
jgi:autotransporter strand-loop-strand O-heptosyltransferase